MNLFLLSHICIGKFLWHFMLKCLLRLVFYEHSVIQMIYPIPPVHIMEVCSTGPIYNKADIYALWKMSLVSTVLSIRCEKFVKFVHQKPSGIDKQLPSIGYAQKMNFFRVS